MDCSREIRNVFVSSTSRDVVLYPNGNNYVVHLTTPIKDIAKVELLHCSVPNSLYNLTANVSCIAATLAADAVSDPVTYFNLPRGFYSASGLATTLTNTMFNTSNISCIYQSSEGKFLFSRSVEPASAQFSLWSNTTEMSSLLGFSNVTTGNVAPAGFTSATVAAATIPPAGGVVPLYSNNSTYVNTNFVKSNQTVNLNPHEGVFLDIHELRTPYNEQGIKLDGGTGGTYSGQNMSRSFGLIPMDVSGGAIKRFKKTSDYDFTIDYPYPLQKIDRLTIEWIDINGQRLNFNGLNDNSFLLRFHTLRKNLCGT